MIKKMKIFGKNWMQQNKYLFITKKKTQNNFNVFNAFIFQKMKSSHGIILIVVSFIHYSYAAAGLNCYKFMNVKMSDDKATLKSVYK